MKRLFVAILCISALSAFAYGATLNRNAQETPSQQQQQDKKAYDVYAGQYEAAAKDFTLTITNEDGKLMGQRSGGAKSEFKAEETVDSFSSSEIKARLKFARNDKGEVTGAIVSMGGKDYWTRKIK